MNPHSKILFPDSQQARSLKTLEDILQAAEQIVEEANPSLFTSRTLSNKSGYALGTLVQRIRSIENVYLWAIKKTRDNLCKEFGIGITQFDPDSSIQTFAEDIVDGAFSAIKKVNPKVIRFFENRFTKINGLPLDYFTYFDVFTEPYLETSSKNKTDTCRQMSKNEAALTMRQIFMMIERPFAEDNPIAGTEEHRKIVINTMIRLLSK